MPRKRQRTPREKKELSLERDRRQSFYARGQKGARKSIPLRKAKENRRRRHKDDQALSVAVRQDDDGSVDLAESSIRHDSSGTGGWVKGADTPLREAIGAKLRKREQGVGRKARTKRLGALDLG